MSRAIITPAPAPLRGTLHLPGDKSISHRRALMSLFVKDEVRLSNYASGDDCRTTLSCIERLGKKVVRNGSEVVITGEFSADRAELDCGNSGTTARLLMGILAAHAGEWTLTGDESLSRRPMERVAEPLRQMGARIELRDGRLPAKITGAELHGIEYDSPVLSAQVKSAVLLAGLRAMGETRYYEGVATRDHTERILGIQAKPLEWIKLDPREARLTSSSLSASIPGDPSSAAFWVAAALMIPDSKLRFRGLLANRDRTFYIDKLIVGGAQIKYSDREELHSEWVATLEVEPGLLDLWIFDIGSFPTLVDEVPALAVVATQSKEMGCFVRAGELRVKESDRLSLIVENLKRMGADVGSCADNFSVSGGANLHGAKIDTGGDHRIAMAFAVAGLAAEGKTVIDNAECVSVSYPEFWRDFQSLAPNCVTFEP